MSLDRRFTRRNFLAAMVGAPLAATALSRVMVKADASSITDAITIYLECGDDWSKDGRDVEWAATAQSYDQLADPNCWTFTEVDALDRNRILAGMPT